MDLKAEILKGFGANNLDLIGDRLLRDILLSTFWPVLISLWSGYPHEMPLSHLKFGIL